MIKSIQVYSDVGPWGDWEPAIRAEMDRLKIPYSERKKIMMIVLLPETMKPKNCLRLDISGKR